MKRTYRTIQTALRATYRMMPALIFALMTSCIDEDLSGCGADHGINYTLRLQASLHTSITTELNLAHEQDVARRLEDALSNIFTDRATDIDLSFYAEQQLAHQEAHFPNASESSFTIYLPVADYRHLAVANTTFEPLVSMEGRNNEATLKLMQQAADTIDSHNIGIFTARKRIKMEDRSQTFDVTLYMQNCSAALVLDHNGHAPEELFAYVKGLACEFNINDSTYNHQRSCVTRTHRFDEGNYTTCYTTGFPSVSSLTRNLVNEEGENGKGKMENEERKGENPLLTRGEGDEKPGLWQMNVYVKEDGKYTESILHVHEPLKAGTLKIIKARIGDNGQIVTDAPEVGVSVVLDWKPGGDHNVEI